MAASDHTDVTGSQITAQVGLGMDGQVFELTVTLTGTFPALADDAARELMHAAHQVCPYSRATRDNIEVTLEVAG